MKNHFCLFFFLNLFSLIYNYETKSSLKKRMDFYKKIEQYSNNQLKLKYDPNSGLSAIANTDIMIGQDLIKIPRNMTLCNYDKFPFREEIIEFIENSNTDKDSNHKSSKLSKEEKNVQYHLNFNLLFHFYSNKEKISNFLKKNNLNHYLSYHKPQDDLMDSIPKLILGGLTFSRKQNQLFSKKLLYKNNEKASIFFKNLKQKIKESELFEILYPWTSDENKFKWVQSAIHSRSYVFPFLNYSNFLSEEEKQSFNSKSRKEAKDGACLFSLTDLMNHQHANLDGYVRRFQFEVKERELIYRINHHFNQGDDVTFCYFNRMSNWKMLTSYGFVISHNDIEIINISEDENLLNAEQLYICKQVECLGKDNKSVSFTFARYKPNDAYLNYLRILNLGENYKKTQVLNSLRQNQIISFINEVSAWTYLIKVFEITEEFLNHLSRSLVKIQNYRNKNPFFEKIKNISFNKRNLWKWKENKLNEYIYYSILSYENVRLTHYRRSLNNIILTTQNELNKLKSKYLSK